MNKTNVLIDLLVFIALYSKESGCYLHCVCVCACALQPCTEGKQRQFFSNPRDFQPAILSRAELQSSYFKSSVPRVTCRLFTYLPAARERTSDHVSPHSAPVFSLQMTWWQTKGWTSRRQWLTSCPPAPPTSSPAPSARLAWTTRARGRAAPPTTSKSRINNPNPESKRERKNNDNNNKLKLMVFLVRPIFTIYLIHHSVTVFKKYIHSV